MSDQVITSEEVKRHNTRKSVWIVIRGEVFDVTAFVNEHPGGEDPLLDAAGMDATIAFDDVGHSEDAKTMLKKYKVGNLAPGHGCRSASRRSEHKGPCEPRVEPRIKSIVVPRERRGGVCRPATPPPSSGSSSSRLKWALLALGIAIVLGIAYKKYSS